MLWLQNNWLEVFFVIVYFGILAHHAWHSRGTRFDAAEMPYWIIAISFFATFASTNTFIGHAGKGFSNRISKLAEVRRFIHIIDGNPGQKIVLKVRIGRTDDDRHVGGNSGHLLQGIDTVHIRHLDVENNEIRRVGR